MIALTFHKLITDYRLTMDLNTGAKQEQIIELISELINYFLQHMESVYTYLSIVSFTALLLKIVSGKMKVVEWLVQVMFPTVHQMRQVTNQIQHLRNRKRRKIISVGCLDDHENSLWLIRTRPLFYEGV